MNICSLQFIIFFIIVSLFIHFSNNIRQQHFILFISNCIFYAYWDRRLLILLLALVFICFLLALKYKSTNKKIFIDIGIFICISVLFVFKYYNFFINSFCGAFNIDENMSLNLVLPLGISFYTFQVLSYLFDVYNGKIDACKSYITLSAYLTFFPNITSGPIVKAHDFMPQLSYVHKIKKDNLLIGIQQITMGITKKFVFADRIGVAVDAVYRAPSAYNSISIIFAIIGYSMQIYFDFSGYSDIAIGIAKILDFDLGKNFDLPYLAKNSSDFWNRWHISLSSWFKEYVYIPLGGNRKGKIRTYLNVLITMILSGLWHGAGITYILWGVFHGIYSIVDKLLGCNTKQKYNNYLTKMLNIIINFVIISLLWVIFRSSSIEQAICIYRGLFNAKGILYVNTYVVVYLIILIILNIIAVIKNNGHVINNYLNLKRFKGQLIYFIWLFLIIAFMYVGDTSFIYANF